jgi:hypothetical protein
MAHPNFKSHKSDRIRSIRVYGDREPTSHTRFDEVEDGRVAETEDEATKSESLSGAEVL